MRKYFIASVLVCLFLIPPILGENTITWRSDFWAWTVLMLGFGAFSTIYLKVNIWLKLLSIYLFVNCMLSQMPIASFTSYHSYVGAFLLYLIFLKLSQDEFKFILKIFPILFMVEGLLLMFQLYDVNIISKALDLGKDVHFGSVSNSMMFGSLIVVMAFLLILNKKWYALVVLVMLLCFPQWHRVLAPYLAGCAFYLLCLVRKNKLLLAILSIVILSVSIFYLTQKQVELSSEGHRGPIWDRAIEMANDKPIIGWGLGTFKYIFPLNSADVAGGWTAGYATKREKWRLGDYEGGHIMWLRAHNFYIQFYWATGIIGILLLAGLYGWIIYRFIISEKTDHLLLTMSGLVATGLVMIETYPDKMVQVVPIMIFMLAYFTKLTEVTHESCRVEKTV